MPPPNFRDLIKDKNKTHSFEKVMAGRGVGSTYDGKINNMIPEPSYANELTFFNDNITFEGDYLTYSA
jgi:hypothetical protein